MNTDFLGQQQNFDNYFGGFLDDTRSIQLLKELHPGVVEFFYRPGKRIRPLVFLHFLFVFGDNDRVDAMKIASVLELFHLGLLIQDDVFDRDSVRRGGDAFHVLLKKHDFDVNSNRTLVLLTHALLTDAYSALISSGISSSIIDDVLMVVNRYSFAAVFGERDDVAGLTLSDDELSRVMINKTAGYSFIAPLLLSYLISGVVHQADLHDPLVHVGGLLGEIFQITDDFLVLAEDSKKDVFSDFRENRSTALTRIFSDRGFDGRGLSSKEDLFKYISREELELCYKKMIEARVISLELYIEQFDSFPLFSESIHDMVRLITSPIKKYEF